ncbi:MAG TPA: hypothetical protein VGK67_10665 [Myxococcales bacterium]
MRTLPLALVTVFAAACAPARGPWMDPGSDCMQCHGPEAHYAWTAAGTVYPERNSGDSQGTAHVYVELTDADGKTVSMETNPVGNFYTSEPLSFPLTARARRGDQRYEMSIPVPVGSCNGCHNLSPDSEPGGRLIGPP